MFVSFFFKGRELFFSQRQADWPMFLRGQAVSHVCTLFPACWGRLYSPVF